jgi:hypothetical protein
MQNLHPQPVACSRGSLRKMNLHFEAEVMWDGMNYLISPTHHETREAALQEASTFVLNMQKALRDTGLQFVGNLKKAEA